MSRYLLRRLLLLLPTVWGVVTLVFALIHFIPGDPVEVMLGETAQPADLEGMRHALGLDRPLGEQYVRFLGGVLRGDLGESFSYREPVARVIARRFPATFILTLAALTIAVLIAIPAGVASAVRQYTWVDHGAMLAALFGISIPSFWMGPMLMLVFAVYLGWFPVSGFERPSAIVLPAITLGMALAGILSRMTRSSMLEVLRAEYVSTARAKGVPEWRVILRHALRNALIPVVTLLGLQFGGLLAGSVITETIFSWPGVGSLLIKAIEARDFPLVQGTVLVIAMVYVLVNLLTDLAYGVVDPRIRTARA